MMIMMTTFKCRAPLYCIIIREHQEQDQRRPWQRWSGFKRVEIIIIMLCQVGQWGSSVAFRPPFTCYHQPTQSTYLTLVTQPSSAGPSRKGKRKCQSPTFRGREPASQPVDYMQKDVISTTSSFWKSIRMSSKLLIPFKLRFRRTCNFTAVNFYWSNLQVQAVKRVSLCALKKRFLKLDFFNFHNSLYLLSNLAGELRCCWCGWRSMRISRSCLRVAVRSSFPFIQPRWRKKKKWKRETIIFK